MKLSAAVTLLYNGVSYKKLKLVSSPTQVWERRNQHNSAKIHFYIGFTANFFANLHFMMTERQLKYFLSSPRFNVYLAKTSNDFHKAYRLYKANIELSEAFYPILSVVEVSLRNAVNDTLKTHFNDPYWFKNYLPPEFLPSVSDAIQKINAQRKNITPDRIIAELNFGFWNRLFNRNYTGLVWKELRLIFKNTPKHLRQRDTIAAILYRIRTLRNRIYHYEPIFENLQDIEKQYNEMLTFLMWLDKGLPNLISDIDRFNDILKKANSI